MTQDLSHFTLYWSGTRTSAWATDDNRAVESRTAKKPVLMAVLLEMRDGLLHTI